jgi:hypothetical protein
VSMLALLVMAIIYAFCAFLFWRGVRNTLEQPILGVLATICMAIAAAAAWDSLRLLDLAMQAYAMGVKDDVYIPINAFQAGSLVVALKYAPLWLLGRG